VIAIAPHQPDAGAAMADIVQVAPHSSPANSTYTPSAAGLRRMNRMAPSTAPSALRRSSTTSRIWA
jgi:hypothetical protein